VSVDRAQSESDARLVARALQGDSPAFGELVRRHLRSAYAIALAALAVPADAEDVCQDSFIVALERLDECRDPDRFAAWLFRIVRNRAHNFRRYTKLREGPPLDTLEYADFAQNPERDAERGQLRERLVSALVGLSEVQREVVILHDMNGWKHREIAALLGLPEGTVRSHLSYARRELRVRLGTQLNEKD
jgi:RNA polymerase sigma-70 factor (ECF subfamily)